MHELLDRDFEFFEGKLYSCQQEYEMGTVPHFKSKAKAQEHADITGEECTPVIEEYGIWVRITRIGYDLSWHGPFYKREEAEAFVEHVWDPVRTGFRVTDDLTGIANTMPSWIRR